VRGLNKSSAFVFVVSKDSIKSTNVLKELTLASDKNKSVYPLFIHDVEVPEEMELALSEIQRLDFFSRDFDAASAKLLVALEGKPRPEPPPPSPVPAPPSPPQPKLSPVFCIHCGARNVADNVFCFQCGKRLR
jgi:hypothetical protein